LAKGVLHNLLLPAVFSLALFAHLGAVTNHHFIERRAQDIRRILR
jgi:cytochrome b561